MQMTDGDEEKVSGLLWGCFVNWALTLEKSSPTEGSPE